MIRTFGLGTSGEKVPFWAVWVGTSGQNRRQIPGKRKNNASGKMAVFGLFFGPRMAISCQKRRPCFDNFPVISCVFHIFSPHNTTQHTHHTTRISLCFLWFSVFFPHAHSTQHTHTRTHTCTPATDRDLQSDLSKSNTRKIPRKMPEKGKARRISGEGSFRYRRANRSSAAKWRKTNRTIC